MVVVVVVGRDGDQPKFFFLPGYLAPPLPPRAAIFFFKVRHRILHAVILSDYGLVVFLPLLPILLICS